VTAVRDLASTTRADLLAVRGALPDHSYPQQEITDEFARVLTSRSIDEAVLRRIHANAGVERRHLALPLEKYAELDGFGHANDVFIETAVRLGSTAVKQALADAGLEPGDVDLIMSTTVTGLAVPSLDARIAAQLGLRPDVKRVPLVGLGCVAGAAGIARVNDYLVGHPGEVALLVAVELCSLTVQRDDASLPNLVASGLFADGASAVVARGASDAEGRAQVLASRSRLYPDTSRAMGWDVSSNGLRIVLDVGVPDLVRTHLREDVDGFLADHAVSRADIGWWVCHPGGPKVLEAVQEALELSKDDVALTWDSLARLGNLSSASLLHVLEDTFRERPPAPGSLGMLVAMGPGFCAEMVLVQAGERR
jgi:alkylresorcinol/alkylpyrone synthase